MAPMFVVATGPSSLPEKGRTFVLHVQIVRRAPNPDPMLLETDLPSGLALVGGQRWESIVDPDQAVVTRTLTVRVDEVPSTDITVTVHANTAQGRFLTSAPFRLGRPDRPNSVVPSLAINAR